MRTLTFVLFALTLSTAVSAAPTHSGCYMPPCPPGHACIMVCQPYPY